MAPSAPQDVPDSAAFNTLHNPAEPCSLGHSQSAQQPQHSSLQAGEFTGNGMRRKHLCNLSLVILTIKIKNKLQSAFLLPAPGFVPFTTIVDPSRSELHKTLLFISSPGYAV